MTEPSARQRFVEAMHEMRFVAEEYSVVEQAMRQAIEAFADAECADNFKMESLKLAGAWEAQKHDHAACRASLLKECGLQIPVDSGGE